MEGYCTCGAQLPPGARFCHRCGKPQGDLLGLEPELEAAQTPPPLPQKAPEPVPISFENRTAVRTGLLASGIAFLLLMIPLPGLLPLLWWVILVLAAGFFAVFWYQRRTHQSLDARSGAKLGWITGVFCFVIFTILMTLVVVLITRSPVLADQYRQQMEGQGWPSSNTQQAIEMLHTPAGIISLLIALFFAFFFLTTLCSLGGMLGASVLEKEK